MSDESWDQYVFGERDESIVVAARLLLWKIIRFGQVSPAQVEVTARVLGVLTRLPKASRRIEACVELTGPRRNIGEHEIYHWWTVNVEGHRIEVSSSGHFYRPSTGGDSFNCLRWSAAPGEGAELSDYLDSLGIVDDAMPFETEVANISSIMREYKLSVTVDGQPLSEFDDDDGEEEEIEEIEEVEIEEVEGFIANDDMSQAPLDCKGAISQHVDMARALQVNETMEDAAERCDLCGMGFERSRFYVDGRLRGDLIWANMCSRCFHQQGEGLGWGSGQLYMRHGENRWLLVAGFRPEDADDSV